MNSLLTFLFGVNELTLPFTYCVIKIPGKGNRKEVLSKYKYNKN